MTATEPAPDGAVATPPPVGPRGAARVCLHPHGPPPTTPQDARSGGAACDERILAEYVYDDGHAYATDLAEQAAPWLLHHGPAPVRDLLDCPARGTAYRELVLDVAALSQWLLVHRPHLQLCAAAAHATASSRWVYDQAHRAQLSVLPAQQARDLTAVLTALDAGVDPSQDPEALIAAAIAATDTTTPT